LKEQTPQSIALYTPQWKNIPLHTLASTDPLCAIKNAKEVWNLKKHLRLIPATVPLLSIDQLSISPLIVKLDAEGAEPEILLGMQQTISIQSHAILMEVTAVGSETVSLILGNSGCNCMSYDTTLEKFFPTSTDTAKNITGSRNRFFVPQEIQKHLYKGPKKS